MKFNDKITPEAVNARKNNMVGNLGIEFLKIKKEYLLAKMPVDERTTQPMGILHGGASVSLAETLGSIGSLCFIDQEKQICVGLEINANHVRSVREGYVYGRATPLHIGRSTHIWEIKITTEEEKLVCISRITIAILDKK